MDILVTGGSGFIGGHLVERLVCDGHKVAIFDKKDPDGFSFNGELIKADIRDGEIVKKAVRGRDVVFHLAGILGTHETMEHVVLTAEVNIVGMLNVLEAARNIKDKEIKIIDVSLTNDWLNPYTITKQTSARFCQMYNKEFGVKVAVVRGLNVYGPRQHWEEVQKAVPTFIVKALRNEPIPIFGDGEQEIDLIHTEDTVDILVKTMQSNKVWGKLIDAGTGKRTKVKDLAKLVIRLARSKSKIVFLPSRPGEPIHSLTLADITAVKKLLGFTPKVSLEDGMKRTVEAYRKQLDRFNE